MCHVEKPNHRRLNDALKVPLIAPKVIRNLSGTRRINLRSFNETTGEKSRFGKFYDGQQTSADKKESFLTASAWLTGQEYG